jgi:hypothetical protein
LDERQFSGISVCIVERLQLFCFVNIIMRLNFARAFSDGRTVETEYETAVFKTHQIGELSVPSGFIVACDPLTFFDSVPFTTQIPVGAFPVILSVACFDNDQE